MSVLPNPRRLIAGSPGCRWLNQGEVFNYHALISHSGHHRGQNTPCLAALLSFFLWCNMKKRQDNKGWATGGKRGVKVGGRTRLRVSVCGSTWDLHSRQAGNYIFLTRKFPVALNHPLSQLYPERSSSYNHMCEEPRQERRPPEHSGGWDSEQLLMAAWVFLVSLVDGRRTEQVGGVLVSSLNTCHPQREGWEAEGTGQKWITGLSAMSVSFLSFSPQQWGSTQDASFA